MGANSKRSWQEMMLWHVRGTRPTFRLLTVWAAMAFYGPDLRGSVARLEGLEPPTGCLEGSCSIRLSYRRPKRTLCPTQVTYRTRHTAIELMLARNAVLRPWTPGRRRRS